MPWRVMCMLSSPCRSIRQGWLLRKSGPSLPRREKFEQRWRLAISPRSPSPSQGPAAPPPHAGRGFTPTGALLQSTLAERGERAGLIWARRYPKPCRQPSAGTRAAQRWLPPAAGCSPAQQEGASIHPSISPSRGACIPRKAPGTIRHGAGVHPGHGATQPPGASSPSQPELWGQPRCRMRPRPLLPQR